MEKSKMLWIASKYAAKGYNKDQLRYGDDLYGMEHFVDEKYKEYKLY
jgi:hypothetical protein